MKFNLGITWWRLIAVVDLAVAGFIITVLVKRAQYFPTTYQRCAQSNDSEPIGKLFAYIALVKNKENDDSTLDSVCQDFLWEWIYTLMLWHVLHEQSSRNILTRY